MKTRRLFPLAALAALAACSAPGPVGVEPSAPLRSTGDERGGLMAGSGNVVATDTTSMERGGSMFGSGTVASTDNTTTPADSTGSGGSEESNERGGSMFGSGN